MVKLQMGFSSSSVPSQLSTGTQLKRASQLAAVNEAHKVQILTTGYCEMQSKYA
jgi:hypothetical protein